MSGGLGRLIKWPSWAIYRRGDAFACISRDIEREALAAGIPRERVHFLPNAVDVSRFRPATDAERLALRQPFSVPTDAVVSLFVGRLSREKGLMDLMEAWRIVQVPAGSAPSTGAVRAVCKNLRRSMCLSRID